MAQGADHNNNNHDSGAPPRLRGAPPGAAEPPVYEVFHGDNQQTDNAQNPDGSPQTTTTTAPNANATPPTLKDTIQSIKADDFLNVHRIPCARQGFLTGIGAGAVVGMGRYMFGARIPKAANWAFGTFLAGSVVQFEVCQAARRKEQAAIARAVEIIDQKKAERAAAKQRQEEKQREEKEREKERARKERSWYRFW